MSRFRKDLSTGRFVRTAVALAAVLVFVTLTPFAVALEVHHELAAADQDGHQHSDSDLCQWVQHHTSSSLLAIVPIVPTHFIAGEYRAHPQALLLSVQLLPTASPRAPPLS